MGYIKDSSINAGGQRQHTAWSKLLTNGVEQQKQSHAEAVELEKVEQSIFISAFNACMYISDAELLTVPKCCNLDSTIKLRNNNSIKLRCIQIFVKYYFYSLCQMY